MNTKEWLNSFIKYDIEIGSVEDELAYLKKRQSPSVEVRIYELEKIRERLMSSKMMLTKIIDKIEDPVARAIYRGRYIMIKAWWEIADRCGGMSERNAHYIHDRVLPEVEALRKEAVAAGIAENLVKSVEKQEKNNL